uniref:Uncharacterized protein n=1 Tax=Trichuris muris TaxID=70415 RepID=A0A5S6QPH1_TRIMR
MRCQRPPCAPPARSATVYCAQAGQDGRLAWLVFASSNFFCPTDLALNRSRWASSEGASLHEEVRSSRDGSRNGQESKYDRKRLVSVRVLRRDVRAWRNASQLLLWKKGRHMRESSSVCANNRAPLESKQRLLTNGPS